VYSIPEYIHYGVYALHRYYPHPRAVPGCITRSSCHSIHNVLNNVPLLANKSASFSVTHPSQPSCTACPTLYEGTLGLNLNVGRYYDYCQAYLIISFCLFCLKISLRSQFHVQNMEGIHTPTRNMNRRSRFKSCSRHIYCFTSVSSFRLRFEYVGLRVG
jgi:hypothetical protein